MKVKQEHNFSKEVVGHIILGTACNLACEYCYEANRPILKMTEENIKDCVDFYFEFAKQNNRKKLSIQLFGGEPFMYLDLANFTVDYALQLQKEKYSNIRLFVGVVTNSTIWNDDVKALLLKIKKECGSGWIQFSTDGIPEVNNMGRPAINNAFNTGEKIEETLKVAAAWLRENNFEEDREFRLNSIVSKKNLPYMYESFKYYCENLGFRSGTRFRCIVEEDWTVDDAQIYNEQLQKIYNYCIMTNKLHVLKNMHQFGAKVKYGLKRSKNIPAMCGVGNKSFCIAPNMKIYPCHRRFFTNPEDFIGEIVNHKGKIIEDKYDFCLTANNPKNICTNGVNCYECLQTKNTYCRICINSNKAKNGSELIGCGGNCLISSIEDIWQTTTYNYFKEKGVVQ